MTSPQVSLAQTTPVQCANCTRRFDAELYVIVESAERPDLIQRIRDDILHCSQCPHCGTVLEFGLPLLIHRPNQSVPVMYSPPPGMSESMRREAWGMLMDALRDRLGPRWDDRLARGVYFADRSDLHDLIDCNPDLLPGGRDPALRHAMDAFMGAETWEETQAVVEQQPVLLGPEADIVLRHGTERSRAANDPDLEATGTEHLQLLRRCRTDGVGPAFAEKLDGSGRTLKLNLASIYNELARLGPDQLERRGALARIALQRLRREDDEETWADLEQMVGEALMATAHRGETGRVEEAAQHFERALEFYSRERDPARWATLKRQLADALELTLGE